MRKTRRNLGFTMAELLIVVAIIIILSGVSFIAVQRHQRSLAQLERNSIAKEIFIAAQNHLTMVESQGFLAGNGTVDFGTPDNSDSTKKNVYCAATGSSTGILDLMLPFGSIDETVRAGGSYLIRYQTNPARVLDVYYCTTSGSPERFNKNSDIASTEFSSLQSKRTDDPNTGYVLGWYGGEEALANGDIIMAPTVEIINAERLLVKVTDTNNNNADPLLNNTNASLKLIITGESSHAQLAITLTQNSETTALANSRFSNDSSMVYTVVLDDITTASAASPHDGLINDSLHFADLNKFADSEKKVLQFMQNEENETPVFKPGENITVQAVAYSNSSLTNIAYSSARTTNSLYADPGEVETTAMIENFRHLENLDADISSLDSAITFTGAEQIADLTWKDSTDGTDFKSKLNEYRGKPANTQVNIYKLNATTGTANDCYLPVNISTASFTYEGNNHTISNLSVSTAAGSDGTAYTGTSIDKGGLFGSFGSNSGTADNQKIQNLELIDFSVKLGSGDAGALAGATTNTAVTNVLARNTTSATFSAAAPNITTASGNAGGLIGNVTNGSVTNSAAAQIVSGTTNAGGLIGLNSAGKISGCYSGGHTQGGVYTDAICYDVTAASGIAGGLIGTSSAAEIRNSYSTCSVKSATAGGFVGKLMSTSEIYGCYCTGRVDGTTEGAFVGLLDTTTGASESCFKVETVNGKEKKCMYFEIINARPGDVSHPYLTALGNNGMTDNIALIDADATSYNTFVGASGNWKQAAYYDTARDDYYRTDADSEDAQTARYSLRTVAQLGATVNETATATTPADFVSVHYGDWPAPETYVLNSAG